MNKKEIMLAVGVCMGIVGIGMMWYLVGFGVTLGVFLLIWSNNIVEASKDE